MCTKILRLFVHIDVPGMDKPPFDPDIIIIKIHIILDSLTNGFVKKTRKTPVGEIEKAKKYRIDYPRRTEEKDCKDI